MKFNGICKYTSTGVNPGITEKPKRTEQKWREE